MTNLQYPDTTARKLALDPRHSFIVQAPAGSGKTSLLVQRYLVLLATVNSPEEILAITFTRKAAFEMRHRIINALKKAAINKSTTNPYEIKNLELAKKVLEQDKIKKWNITQNPNRLRIQTIDSFCHYLVNQVPILSKINPNFQIAQNQDADIYYRKAAKAAMENLNNPDYSKYLKELLLHLDNNWQRTENLFITMLKSREQWLPHVMGAKNIKKLRQVMENGLKEISEENIERCISFLPKESHNNLKKLLVFSCTNQENHLELLKQIESEGITKISITIWNKIATLLLTKEHSWRKKVTKAHGFPSSNSFSNKIEKENCKLMKERMENLLTKFSENEKLRQSLENLILSPPPYYTDQQWKIIDALIELLPLLVAELKLIFNENLTIDHSEISMAAIFALGDKDTPSELALNLEYRLQHLLLDEFQDTSISQYKLIEQLITTWQPYDGRTIFMVGDPMQSIYKFREAEVGLFLRVQNDGIGNIKPNPLALSTNFRSSKNIIDWINKNFSKILPALADINFGAVPFKSSTSVLDHKHSEIDFSLVKDANDEAEAKLIISKLKSIHKNHPTDNIAILVKSRNHLEKIIPCLNKNCLEYQAFELETLQTSAIIKDLFSLTSALLDLNNRIAWLAILRAPWCGLKLDDLQKLANGEQALIWDNITNYKVLKLSDDGNKRVIKLLKSLNPLFEERGRIPWHELIKKVWLAIGGPATIDNEAELEHAESYFELIKNSSFDIEILQKKLSTLYTQTKSDAKIQIMTIHKAKGLEFDHVIVPGVNKTTKTDDRKLMLWFERPKLHKGSELLLAPIEEVGKDNDPIYKYLRLVEQKKTFYETGRLLYVAMTRAKKSIHITGYIKNPRENQNLSSNIQAGSLLEQFKPCFNKEWVKTNTFDCNKLNDSKNIKQSKLIRLTSNWTNPTSIDIPTKDNSFNWDIKDTQASIIGTIIHHCLRQISEENIKQWDNNHIDNQKQYWNKLLKQAGYIDIKHGLDLIKKAIKSTIADERGRWILKKHSNAFSELQITVNFGTYCKNYIIDRTFVDEDEIRWIIDYKTSTPSQDTTSEFFLKTELEKYSKQLTNYALAIKKLEPKIKIKTALYFPIFSGWIEFDPNI